MNISFWKKNRPTNNNKKKTGRRSTNAPAEIVVPDHFLCPISHDLMKDPVTLPTGITYDRAFIDTWLESGHLTCPLTNTPLSHPPDLLPNHAIRIMIQDWCVQNRVDRIPTPKVPITVPQVLDLLSEVQSSVVDEDRDKCVECVQKIKVAAKESERNRRCMNRVGTGPVLAEAFDSFARMEGGRDFGDRVFEEILSAFRRHDDETSRILSTRMSVRKIVSVMRFGSLNGRMHAVIALKSILSLNAGEIVNDVVDVEGCLETLVKLIKEPICPATTKASLLSLYHMLTLTSPSELSERVATRLVEVESIPMLIELLVDAEKSICEKALGVLDGLCSHEDGRRMACQNALTVPVLVKKVLRVSHIATELAILVLLKVGKRDDESDGVIAEALQAGAFQKLLLVLQIGTSEETKDKVTELLKMMNLERQKVDECSGSLEMKHVKRSF